MHNGWFAKKMNFARRKFHEFKLQPFLKFANFAKYGENRKIAKFSSFKVSSVATIKVHSSKRHTYTVCIKMIATKNVLPFFLNRNKGNPQFFIHRKE